jgi:hypothetical protein
MGLLIFDSLSANECFSEAYWLNSQPNIVIELAARKEQPTHAKLIMETLIALIKLDGSITFIACYEQIFSVWTFVGSNK